MLFYNIYNCKLVQLGIRNATSKCVIFFRCKFKLSIKLKKNEFNELKKNFDLRFEFMQSF